MSADPFQAALLNGGVLPPTNPVQPQAQPVQAGTQQDPMAAQALQGMQQGQQLLGEQVQRQRNLADTAAQLQQQRAQMQMPKMGYQPQFKPMNSAGNVLGDIGKGLLLGLSATGPGRAVEGAIYGPRMRQYAAQSGSLAQQIQELQEQQKIEEQPLGSAAQIATRPFSGYGSFVRGEASLMNAQTQRVAEQHKNAVQTEANRIRQQLGEGKLKAEDARTQLMGVIQKEKDATLWDVAGLGYDRATQVEQMREAEKDWETESNHWLQDVLGIAPSKPVTPAGATPPAKSGKGKSASGGVVKWGRDKNGNPVKLNATTGN